MKFFHNSRIGTLAAGLGAEAVEQTIDHKPGGFWFDVDGDWLRWMRSEMPEWVKPYWYEVVVPRDFRMLRISTCRALDEFTEEFRARDARVGTHRTIHWGNVAHRYDGIVIAPYQYRRRLDPSTSWYYSWDVASGCVWSNLAALRLRKTTIEAVKSHIVEIPA